MTSQQEFSHTFPKQQNEEAHNTVTLQSGNNSVEASSFFAPHPQLFSVLHRIGKTTQIARYLLAARKLITLLREQDHNNGGTTFQFAAAAHLPGFYLIYPSMWHSLEVALILVEQFGLGEPSLAATFLYPYYHHQLINDEDVSKLAPAGTLPLLKGLETTIQLYTTRPTSSAEMVSDLLLSSAGDLRVLLIMIADRLYRLRKVKQWSTPEDAAQLGNEIATYFIPFTHKLGLYAVKGELEDLSLKYTQPDVFYDIKKKLGEKKATRDSYNRRVVRLLEEKFSSSRIRWPYMIKSRSKTIYSIYNKMQKKATEFNDIYDLSALRIIIDAPPKEEEEACWYFYSLVTDLFVPHIERLRDWVTVPKSNGYQSLQITVTGPDNKFVEVQIRTQRMDEIAEHGVAAHWRYKGLASGKDIDGSIERVRTLLNANANSNVEDVRAQLYKMNKKNIYLFTPNGDVKKLPYQATLLDFAFAIHSNVGAKAKSGKVNGKNVSLRTILHNGDTVEVITDKNQTPSEDWLQFVVSQSAKNKIRRILREEIEGSFSTIREQLERRLKNRKLPYDEKTIVKVINQEGFANYNSFYTAINEDRYDLNHFLECYSNELKKANEAHITRNAEEHTPTITAPAARVVAVENVDRHEKGIVIGDGNVKGMSYELAKCCNPQYGDPIYAYPSRTGLRIHRYDCPNSIDIFRNYRDRVLPAHWSNLEDACCTNLYIESEDAPEITARIVSLCKGTSGVKLLSYNMSVKNQHAESEFTLLGEAQAINTLRNKLLEIKGVKSVSRA